MLTSIAALISALDPQGSGSAPQTITGRVVSLSYYGQNKTRPGGGLDQRLGEARASVKWEGMPAGVVTSDGKAYQVAGGLAANNNAKIVELLGRTVTITGPVSEQHGMLVITADTVKAGT